MKNYHPENPLDFWKIYRDGTVFSEIARKILAIPASSAIVERLFSYAGINEGKLRTSMAPDIIKACIIVYNHHAKQFYFPKVYQ